MSYFEKSSLIVSIFAIIFSIISIAVTVIIAKKNKELVQEANNKAVQANTISMGALENAVSDRISNAKLITMDSSIKLAEYLLGLPEELTPGQKHLLDTYELHFNSCVENSWNAYEDACAKYLDEKIDKERFKKSYKNEIKQLIEDTKDAKYKDSLTSKYRAVIKVYREWEDLEN